MRQVLPQRPSPAQTLEDPCHPEGSRLPRLRQRLPDLDQVERAPAGAHGSQAVPVQSVRVQGRQEGECSGPRQKSPLHPAGIRRLRSYHTGGVGQMMMDSTFLMMDSTFSFLF